MSIVVIDHLMVKIVISIFKLGKCTLKRGGGTGDLFLTPVSGGGIPILMFSVN